MPGMGSFGTETIAGFYPYLLIDLAIVVGLIWLDLGLQLVLRRRQPTPGEAAAGDSTGAAFPARLFLRRTLGIIWILDGLLQAQPAMPGDFAKAILAPASLGQPAWLANLLHWEAYFWQAHPLDLAVATVLIQVGIGAAILAGGDSILGRTGLWLSIGWALFVWVGGEAMGGLLISGATQLMGSPGAVLVYAAAAALLLAPLGIWRSQQLGQRIRMGVGALLIFGSLLQAIPWEGFWTAKGMRAMFRAMAAVPQPRFLSNPVTGMAHLASAQPVLLNTLLIVAMLSLGVGLVSGRRPGRWTVATLIWLALTWWIGQDFGALGSKVATDPNLSPLLALMLATAWIATRPGPAVQQAAQPSRSWQLLRRNLALGGLVAIVVGMVPVMLGLPVAAAQSATIEALNTGGPLSPMDNQSVPSLSLVNQDGKTVNLRQWSDKALVITFLDPVCFDVCPIIAEQLAAADRQLGPLAKDTEFIAVVANPIYRSQQVVRAFDQNLGLNSLPNWQYLTGSLPQLERAWADFSIEIAVPRLSMVEHPPVLYFAKPGGQEVSQAQDSALANASVLTSYVALIDQEVRATLQT